MYVLTREDARQRSASIKVRHIDVSLDLSGATRESHFPVCSHMTLVTATPDLFIACAGIVQQVRDNVLTSSRIQICEPAGRRKQDVGAQPARMQKQRRKRPAGCP